MKAIKAYSLIGYIQCGGTLLSLDFIDAYHQHIKTFYARNKSTLNLNGSYPGGGVVRNMIFLCTVG